MLAHVHMRHMHSGHRNQDMLPLRCKGAQQPLKLTANHIEDHLQQDGSRGSRWVVCSRSWACYPLQALARLLACMRSSKAAAFLHIAPPLPRRPASPLLTSRNPKRMKTRLSQPGEERVENVVCGRGRWRQKCGGGQMGARHACPGALACQLHFAPFKCAKTPRQVSTAV